VRGIEGGQDLHPVFDLNEAQAADHHEPDDQDRTEHAADARRSLILQGEQAGQDADGDRHGERGEAGSRDAHALDRGQHADRGGDQPVAEQQTGPQHQAPQ
jgi:hypothetical protein